MPGPFARIAGAAGVLLHVTLTASAQLPVPLGGEVLVNRYTSSTQSRPSVGMDDAGNFVVVWDSYGQDGHDLGVFARRFDSTGTPLAVEFQVNLYTSNDQMFATADMNASGSFVVVWRSTLAQDGSSDGVFGRRFDASGAPQAGEFQVPVSTLGGQSYPEVALANDGKFVVAWTAETNTGDIFLRRFNAAGAAQGGEVRANTYTSGQQAFPDVSMDDDGDFVAVWTSYQEGDFGIFGQRYSSAGGPQGPEFHANSFQLGNQIVARVALDADGDFVVVWQSYGQDFPYSQGIIGRRFSSVGTPLAAEFQVNAFDTTDQYLPDVASNAPGDFVVTWQSGGQDGDGFGIFLRRFRQSGLIDGFDTQVNTVVAGTQQHATIASSGGGKFVVAWQGEPSEIFAQRFEVTANIDVDGDGQFLPLTDGLLILRHAFGFTGATLINGAVGQGCTRCDAPSITAYLQGLE